MVCRSDSSSNPMNIIAKACKSMQFLVPFQRSLESLKMKNLCKHLYFVFHVFYICVLHNVAGAKSNPVVDMHMSMDPVAFELRQHRVMSS